MYFLIDGYNLIFSLIKSKESLKTLRSQVIVSLQKLFTKRKISGTLVFDGAHLREEESGLSYSSPLIIAYTPKGQSADEYIVEQIKGSSHPKQMIVITNDRGLQGHAKSYGAKVQPNDEFIQWLHKPQKRKKQIEPRDTQQNLDRLLKIFEDKLKNDSDDF